MAMPPAMKTKGMRSMRGSPTPKKAASSKGLSGRGGGPAMTMPPIAPTGGMAPGGAGMGMGGAPAAPDAGGGGAPTFRKGGRVGSKKGRRK